MIRRKWVFAAVIATLGGAAQAGKVCDLTFSECPGRFANGVIKVPPELIWLDAKIPYCNEFVRITNGNAKPPSIVFIIDNSGSMDENDPQVSRFNVVASLLDNIQALVPAAEVGLVVFTRRLSFDHRENPFFKTAFPGDTAQHDSFVPLTALNKVFPDGRTGLDTLKALLGHDADGNLTYVTKLPASRNNSGMGRSNTRDGTDISLGFMAAKVAMKDSKSDKSGQFFVFLSDGTPSTPDNGRENLINEFISGTNVPATFTVYFDTQNSTPVAPNTIVQMTGNIKANAYSTANAKSAYWAINMPGTQLQDLLQNEVVGNVLSVPAKPKQATLATRDSTYHSAGLDEKNFLFSRHLNLERDTTRVELDYTYTYLDTSGGASVSKEKTVPYALTIVRSGAVSMPQGLSGSCHDQAQVGLYKNGQPLTAVSVDDAAVEARLTMPDGSACKGCRLQVLPSSGRVKDQENVELASAAGYMTGTFQQEVNPSAVPGDGRLQHLPMDSIVVLYVSPENPLDAVRRAYPYRGAPTVLNLGHDTGYVRCPWFPANPATPQFVMIAPQGFRAFGREPIDRWNLSEAQSPADAARYAGVTVEASRAFAVDIRVFTNLGEFVNKLEFTVMPEDFEKLAKTADGHSRRLKVLWDSRSLRGAAVGTGAYVVKTTVSLLPIPGVAEDKQVRVDYRRVGVLRSL